MWDKKCQTYCLFALSMLSMTLEKRFFREKQENNHIRKADQRQVVCNQLTRCALGSECSFPAPSVCWTPPHYNSSKIQSEWAVWFFFIGAGVDQALPQERRTPVTPSSSSRYHRRRSSGSRDERYRSGECHCRPQNWNENFKCLLLFLAFFKKKFVVNSCSSQWGTFIVRIERRCARVQGWSYKAKIHLELVLVVSGCKKILLQAHW